MRIYTAAITLFLIMDPFGNIPVFLATLGRFPPRRRRFIILRESLIAFVILAFFLFFGRYILQGLHITQPALGISGGTILFLIAIRMIFPGRNNPLVDGDEETGDPVIVPLAVPLLAGPSSMAFIILSSSQYPHERLSLLLSLVIASAVCTLILILSDYLRKFLGTRLLRAIERLMGMILTTLAVQMLLTGLQDFF